VNDATDFEQEIGELYDLPPEEFVSARNELAKRAGAEGEKAVSARIKELRKPSISVWLVNRLARERELDVQRLLKAGERLAEAQREVVGGKTPDDFLQARGEEQRAVSRLGKAAREILAREGHGTSALEPATRTLRAAALTEEGRRLLKTGRVPEELEAPGFEALSGVKPAPRRRGSAAKPSRTQSRARVRELERKQRALAAKAEEAARRAEEAARKADELREAAEAAQAEADAAEAEYERARAALDAG
jgi:hypothetical protein